MLNFCQASTHGLSFILIIALYKLFEGLRFQGAKLRNASGHSSQFGCIADQGHIAFAQAAGILPSIFCSLIFVHRSFEPSIDVLPLFMRQTKFFSARIFSLFFFLGLHGIDSRHRSLRCLHRRLGCLHSCFQGFHSSALSHACKEAKAKESKSWILESQVVASVAHIQFSWLKELIHNGWNHVGSDAMTEKSCRKWPQWLKSHVESHNDWKVMWKGLRSPNQLNQWRNQTLMNSSYMSVHDFSVSRCL